MLNLTLTLTLTLILVPTPTLRVTLAMISTADREHASAFMAHPELAAHVQNSRLWLISEDFGMARVAVGTAGNDSDRFDRQRLSTMTR